MVRARVALAALVIALVTGSVLGVRQVAPVGFDGSPGSLSLLLNVFTSVAFLLNPVCTVVLGYAVGRATRFEREYGGLSLVTGLAALLGIFVGYATILVTQMPDLVGVIGTLVVAGTRIAVTGAATFVIAFVAGGAVATFRSDAVQSVGHRSRSE